MITFILMKDENLILIMLVFRFHTNYHWLIKTVDIKQEQVGNSSTIKFDYSHQQKCLQSIDQIHRYKLSFL